MDRLEQEYQSALENYETNKKAGSPAESLAYDAGLIAGLSRGLEIAGQVIEDMKEKRL